MISSVANPTVRRVRRLRKRAWRERTRQFLAEGHRCVAAALDTGAALSTVLYTERAVRLRGPLLSLVQGSGARTHEVSEDVMAFLTSVTTAPDMLAVAPIRETTLDALSGDALTGVILARVHDPATAGGVMASAAAAGARTAIGVHGTVDMFLPKTVRAGQGAHFRLGIVRDVDEKDAVAHVRRRGGRVVAIAGDAPAVWDTDLRGPLMVVVDEEDRTDPLDADARLSVPAAAGAPPLTARAAVVLYEWMRQRDRDR